MSFSGIFEPLASRSFPVEGVSPVVFEEEERSREPASEDIVVDGLVGKRV
jgi:hypothetical protein